MPLSAYVNGEYRYGPGIPPERWAALMADKRRDVRLPCGRRGFLRRSTLGTQHFYHDTRHPDCPWAGESEAHVETKRTIVAAGQAAGWTCQTERSGGEADDAWRVDVLVTAPPSAPLVPCPPDGALGPRRWAFEVQLSPQDAWETDRRETRYRIAGIQGVWLMREVPDREPWMLITERWRRLPLGDIAALRLVDGGLAHASVDVMAPRHTPSSWWREHFTAPTGPAQGAFALEATRLPGRVPLNVFVQRWLACEPTPATVLRVPSEGISLLTISEVRCTRCETEVLAGTRGMPLISACGAPVDAHPWLPDFEGAASWHYVGQSTDSASTRDALAAWAAQHNDRRPLLRWRKHDHSRSLVGVCPTCEQDVLPSVIRVAEQAPLAVLRLPVVIPPYLQGDWECPHWCLAPTAATCCPSMTSDGTISRNAGLTMRYGPAETLRLAPFEEQTPWIRPAAEQWMVDAGFTRLREIASGGTQGWLWTRRGMRAALLFSTEHLTVQAIEYRIAAHLAERSRVLWLTPASLYWRTPGLSERGDLPVLPIERRPGARSDPGAATLDEFMVRIDAEITSPLAAALQWRFGDETG